MTQVGDVRRQELLERIRTRQAAMDKYVRKMGRRRELLTRISIVSSTTAAALAVGPALTGDGFTEIVQRGLGWTSDSNVYRLLCLPIVIINIVAAVFTKLNSSSDPSERISKAEDCNSDLEKLYADVQFGKVSVSYAGGEYGRIASKALFVLDDDSADNADSKKRINVAVAIPSIAIVFGCVALLTSVVGFGRGFAATGQSQSILELSNSVTKDGDTYSATARGFMPGEVVKFSWDGGPMADAPRADPTGSTTLFPIVETAPPGTYTITASGQTSGYTATAKVQVVPSSN